MNRKRFIRLSIGLTAAAGYLSSCKSSSKKLKGEIVGASSSIGHLLREGKFPEASDRLKKKIVIVGGGVSGLSAARQLHKNGIDDFILLDLEKHVGGNASWGKNEISAYPWGAHYVPIPNNDLKEYLDFLRECDVVTGEDERGLPAYNELHLCFDPQERLYINGKWQDGLIPQFGVPANELGQINTFMHLMDEYRQKKGEDGKDMFAIPVDNSSKDESFIALDQLTMSQWLKDKGFTSEYLHSYINYCCRDDFGTPHDLISAWAGLHYFASRKGKGSNVEHGDVLTWPEGNGFLVQHLYKEIQKNIQNNSLVIGIKPTAVGIEVKYFDVIKNSVTVIESEYCIVAVPQFAASRLLNDESRKEIVKHKLNYTPWMVANILVDSLKERSGAPLSWDNVLHESKSLGYVVATHELVQQSTGKKNLTYYLPLTDGSPAEQRKIAQQKSHEDWTEFIINDLERVHPNIRSAIEEVNIMIWGHAMAQPLPGLIFGDIRKELSTPLNNRIYFAHTDLAGISIFEEAFYQGLAASNKILEQLK